MRRGRCWKSETSGVVSLNARPCAPLDAAVHAVRDESVAAKHANAGVVVCGLPHAGQGSHGER